MSEPRTGSYEPNQIPGSAVLFSRRRLIHSALGALGFSLVCVVLSLVLLVESDPEPPDGWSQERGAPATWVDTFEGEVDKRWVTWRGVHPTRGTVVATEGGLQIGVDTLEAHPRTVYRAGARSQGRFHVEHGLRIQVIMDWNPPDNASLRSAGLLLTSAAPLGDPLDLKPAVRLEVVGVPPGRTARLYAALQMGVHPRPLFTDGWPEERAGRSIGEAVLEIELRPGSLILRENGQEVASVADPPLGGSVWIALYTTSYANFPARPVLFKRVSVEYLPPEILGG